MSILLVQNQKLKTILNIYYSHVLLEYSCKVYSIILMRILRDKFEFSDIHLAGVLAINVGKFLGDD